MFRDTIPINTDQRAGAIVATGLAAAALSLFAVAEPAKAQEGADSAIDEIIVTTARRREESLMEVPLSISVLDRLSDAALLVPGGRVLVQHPRTSPHPDRVGRLDVVRSKRYGDSLVTTYRAPLVE